MIHSEKSGISKLIKSDGESSEKSLNFNEWTEQYFYYKKYSGFGYFHFVSDRAEKIEIISGSATFSRG